MAADGAVVRAGAGFDGEIGFGVDGIALGEQPLHHRARIVFLQQRTMYRAW